MISRNGTRAILAGLLALALVPASAAAAPAVGPSFPVPGIGTNNKIVEGQDGNIWVTVSNGIKDVARITPSGGVTEFDLKTGVSELENASGIAKDAEGRLWVTGEGKVAKFSPSTNPEGSATVEDLAQVKAGASIVLGPDGNMWVASTEVVVRFPPSQPDPENTRQLFPIAELLPHDIDVAGQLLVIADQGNRIVTLTTGGTEKDYALDPVAGFSQGVAGNKSGLIAYSNSGSDPQRVGLISPPDFLTPINTPGGIGDPFGVAVGADDAFWFVLGGEGVDRLARLTASGQLSFVDGLPAKTQGRQIASGPNNTLWVTLSKENQEGVVRVTGVEPPGGSQPPPPPGPPRRTTPPETTLAKGPKRFAFATGTRATVKFRFSSPDAGASFECRLKQLGGGGAKGSKVPRFTRCKSPKTYRLTPGRYRFEVRALLAGLVDGTPASRSVSIDPVSPGHGR